MKKLYFILFILLNQLAFAQGNLQFNQVKLVTALETVPAGKVWKIESVIYNIAEGSTTYQTGNSGNCTSSDYNSAAIIVAGTPTKVGQGTSPLGYPADLMFTHTLYSQFGFLRGQRYQEEYA